MLAVVSCRHLLKSIAASRSLGSTSFISKDDAATVAAEARWPIEPEPGGFNQLFKSHSKGFITFAHPVFEIPILRGNPDLSWGSLIG